MQCQGEGRDITTTNNKLFFISWISSLLQKSQDNSYLWIPAIGNFLVINGKIFHLRTGKDSFSDPHVKVKGFKSMDKIVIFATLRTNLDFFGI